MRWSLHGSQRYKVRKPKQTHDTHGSGNDGRDGMPLNDAVMNVASPLRGGNLTFERFKHLKEKALGERGACIRHEAPAPLAMASPRRSPV